MLTLESQYLTFSDRSSGTRNDAKSLKIEQDNKDEISRGGLVLFLVLFDVRVDLIKEYVNNPTCTSAKETPYFFFALCLTPGARLPVLGPQLWCL